MSPVIITTYRKIIFGNGFINPGIGGDRVEHVLWRVRDTVFPPRLTNVVILFGTNNNKDPLNIFISGLLLRDECFTINFHFTD